MLAVRRVRQHAVRGRAKFCPFRSRSPLVVVGRLCVLLWVGWLARRGGATAEERKKNVRRARLVASPGWVCTGPPRKRSWVSRTTAKQRPCPPGGEGDERGCQRNVSYPGEPLRTVACQPPGRSSSQGPRAAGSRRFDPPPNTGPLCRPFARVVVGHRGVCARKPDTPLPRARPVNPCRMGAVSPGVL